MVKKILASASLILLSLPVWAQNQPRTVLVTTQRFTFSAGLGTHQYQNTGKAALIPSFFFTPRYQFDNLGTTDFSLTFGMPLSLGYQVARADSSYFFGNIPLLAEINIGHLSTKDFRTRFGFFLGTGGAASLIRNDLHTSIAATTGFRFWFIRGSSVTLRFMHHFPVWLGNQPLNSISISLNLGKWIKDVKKNNKISDFMKPYRK